MSFTLNIVYIHIGLVIIYGIGKSRLYTWGECIALSDGFDGDVSINLDWSGVMFAVFSWIASIGCVINVGPVCACVECNGCACGDVAGCWCGENGLGGVLVWDEVLVITGDEYVVVFHL